MSASQLQQRSSSQRPADAHRPAAERVPNERDLTLRPAGGKVEPDDVAHDGVERERKRVLVLDEAVEAGGAAVLEESSGQRDQR